MHVLVLFDVHLQFTVEAKCAVINRTDRKQGSSSALQSYKISTRFVTLVSLPGLVLIVRLGWDHAVKVLSIAADKPPLLACISTLVVFQLMHAWQRLHAVTEHSAVATNNVRCPDRPVVVSLFLT